MAAQPPLSDPTALLLALRGPVEACALGPPNKQWNDTVHTLALRNVVTAELPDELDAWLKVCCRLIELGAPIESGVEPSCAAGIFTSYPPRAPCLEPAIAAAADAYVRAGLMPLGEPMAGRITNYRRAFPNAGLSCEGLVPLAGAIANDNSFFVSYLLDRGAGLDAGCVFLDQPSLGAIDLADLLQSRECHAVLVAHLMHRRLDAFGSGTVAAAVKAKRRAPI